MEKRGNTELQHCHRCNINHEADLHEQQEGPYWDSPAGITRRIRMISEQFTFKIVNGATKIYGETSGYKWLVWITRADERVCPICGPRHLKRWRITAFTPRIPAHLNCRCVFQLEGPELPPPGKPTVPRITQVIRGKQQKLIAKRDDWATDINIVSERRLFLIFFTADDERTRMIRWDELEMALLMRGFEEVEVRPLTISDEIFWQTVGFQRVGKNRFVKRVR